MNRLVVGFLVCGLWFTTSAQVLLTGKTFSSFELSQLLNDFEGDALVFENCNFTHSAKDDLILWAYDDYTDDSSNGHRDLIPKKLIDFPVEFKNCKFNEGVNQQVVFLSFNFQSLLLIKNCVGYGIRFDRCVFGEGLKVEDLSLRYFELADCRFFENLILDDVGIVKFNVYGCKFIYSEYSTEFGIDFEGKDSFSDFHISNCEFLDNSWISLPFQNLDSVLHESSVINFHSFDADHFHIYNCTFDCSIQLGNFSVDRSFEYENNSLYRKIIFEQAPNIPSESSTMKYSSIEGRIGSAYPIGGGVLRFNRYDDEREYRKDEIRPWIDTDVEKNIIPVYNKLLTVYDASADIESYNKCYNQMKKIEKTASKIKFETEGAIIHWFRWKMDTFLEYFNAYGTDPILSLVNSFYWILAFAILYIIFPSEEDNLRFHNIRQAITRYVDHFSEQQKKFLSSDEIYRQELANIETMKAQFHANLEKLPPIVSFIGMPFYYLAFFFTVVRHRIRSVVKFNLFQDWRQLNRAGRFKTTSIITVNFIGFFLWGIIMRLVNSMALSLNAFVTLGYGELEAKGIARYFCVVEGLIGWFLLSIFSVSLISQILQ